MCTHVHTHSHAYAHTCTCAHTHAHTCRLTGPLGEQPWPYGTQGTGPGHIEGAQGSTPRPSVAIRIPGSLVPRSPPCLPPPLTLAQLTVSMPVPHFLGWRGSQARAVRPGLVPGALPAQHPPHLAACCAPAPCPAPPAGQLVWCRLLLPLLLPSPSSGRWGGGHMGAEGRGQRFGGDEVGGGQVQASGRVGC